MVGGVCCGKSMVGVDTVFVNKESYHHVCTYATMIDLCGYWIVNGR